MIKRLVYIANARFPTQKAHGYQICKMSEAFVQCGVRVLLLHPYRRQLNATLQRQSVFDYYDLPEVFEVKTLSNFDVLLIEHLLPKTQVQGVGAVRGDFLLRRGSSLYRHGDIRYDDSSGKTCRGAASWRLRFIKSVR